MTASYDQTTRKDAVPAWVRSLRIILGLYALLGGLTSFLGWALNIPRLTDWSNTGVSIQPNSSIAVLLGGAAILLLSGGWRRTAAAAGLFIAAIGISSAIQLVFKVDLGINTLLMFDREWGRKGALGPGQIGTPGTISWTLIGISLLLAGLGRINRNARLTAVSLAVLTTAISALSLTGYLYGAETLYTLPQLTVIAIQTATFVLAISVAIVFCLPDVGPAGLLTEESAAGLMARRVIPAIVFVPILLGFARLAGEKAGYYDLAFGTAARTLIEIVLLLLLLLWTAQAVRRQSVIADERGKNLQALADAMPQVLWIADQRGKVHYYNDRAANFRGIEPGNYSTYDWQPNIHAEDLSETESAWNAAVQEGKVFEHEHRIMMHDGTYRWHLSRAVPVGDGNGTDHWYGTATDIDDIKGAEQRVRESEQRFSRFMHHLPGLAWIKDRFGRYVYVNEAAEKAFRRPAAELYGHTDAEIFAPEIAEVFAHNDQQALESDTGIQVIETLRNDDRDVRDSIVSKFAIHVADPDGPFIGGMAIDITEQRRAQLNEAFLFRVAEMIRTGKDPDTIVADICRTLGEHLNLDRCLIGELDFERQTTSISNDHFRNGESLAGTYSISEVSDAPTIEELKAGQTIVNRDSQQDPRTAQHFGEIYRSRSLISYVAVPMLRDGELKGYMFSSHDEPHDWSAAEIALVETVAERTWAAIQRMRAERALLESEERYRLAQQAGNVGVWDWDIASDRTYWSEQMWTLYDEPPQAIDPDIAFWNNHVHPDDRQRALDVFERTLSSDADHHNDVFRIVRKDNSVRWIESIATIERDSDGKAVRMYGVNLDITELQVAHDELEVRVVERTQELAKANTMLLQQMEERAFIEEQRIQLLKRLFTVQEDERGRIARDIHDHLGQRLTALRLKIASMRALCEDNQVLSERVNRLQEISELLDKEVSFLAWELRPDILDQTDFAHALEQYVTEWSRHSDVFAEFSLIGPKKPKLDKDIENNLYRITQEALNNAAKYAQATQINVILEHRGDNLVLIVEDNGIGFDASDERVQKSRKGFGLVGMRERASLIGGTLEIESVPGEGTTIFVRVPLGQGE